MYKIASENIENALVAVVIPSYKVRNHIVGVVDSIGDEVDLIYVVDDACPEGSGAFASANCTDYRLRVITHAQNQGVGGAVMTGYRAAIEEGATVIVKIDGDGQMDPALIPAFVGPILAGDADYTKGNRFYDLDAISAMPAIRIFGNAVLSLLTKCSSGYWDLFDPTNGYTAIHRDVARLLPFAKISSRYFFETDMLFRLNIVRAVAMDIPMDAKYGDEISNLRISAVIGEFLSKNIRNFAKRIFYNYYLRDLSLPSIELPLGLLLFFGGAIFGITKWIESAGVGMVTPAGTVMLSALPILAGLQLVLAFLSSDIGAVPRVPKHTRYLVKTKSEQC